MEEEKEKDKEENIIRGNRIRRGGRSKRSRGRRRRRGNAKLFQSSKMGRIRSQCWGPFLDMFYIAVSHMNK